MSYGMFGRLRPYSAVRMHVIRQHAKLRADFGQSRPTPTAKMRPSKERSDGHRSHRPAPNEIDTVQP